MIFDRVEGLGEAQPGRDDGACSREHARRHGLNTVEKGDFARRRISQLPLKVAFFSDEDEHVQSCP